LISPIKGLKSDEITRILITPSQLIDNYLREIRDRYEVVCIGGPFFDVDIALGNPVCVTVAGERKLAELIRKAILGTNRRELTSYYNYDVVGIEACGALKTWPPTSRG